MGPAMTQETHRSGAPWRNFYGRIHGKKMNRRKQEMLETDLARISPGRVSWQDNPDRAPIDLDALFPGREVWLEIGFGGGEHMVAMAARYPDIGLIGAEPYVNGVAQLLGRIREANVSNLSVHAGDIRDLFDVLPERRIARVFLNYPDPWPKARHHKRRLSPRNICAPSGGFCNPGPSSVSRRISRITCARRLKRCRQPGSKGWIIRRGRHGRTGHRHATNRRRFAKGAGHIT